MKCGVPILSLVLLISCSASKPPVHNYPRAIVYVEKPKVDDDFYRWLTRISDTLNPYGADVKLDYKYKGWEDVDKWFKRTRPLIDSKPRIYTIDDLRAYFDKNVVYEYGSDNNDHWDSAQAILNLDTKVKLDESLDEYLDRATTTVGHFAFDLTPHNSKVQKHRHGENLDDWFKRGKVEFVGDSFKANSIHYGKDLVAWYARRQAIAEAFATPTLHFTEDELTKWGKPLPGEDVLEWQYRLGKHALYNGEQKKKAAAERERIQKKIIEHNNRVDQPGQKFALLRSPEKKVFTEEIRSSPIQIDQPAPRLHSINLSIKKTFTDDVRSGRIQIDPPVQLKRLYFSAKNHPNYPHAVIRVEKPKDDEHFEYWLTRISDTDQPPLKDGEVKLDYKYSDWEWPEKWFNRTRAKIIAETPINNMEDLRAYYKNNFVKRYGSDILETGGTAQAIVNLDTTLKLGENLDAYLERATKTQGYTRRWDMRHFDMKHKFGENLDDWFKRGKVELIGSNIDPYSMLYGKDLKAWYAQKHDALEANPSELDLAEEEFTKWLNPQPGEDLDAWWDRQWSEEGEARKEENAQKKLRVQANAASKIQVKQPAFNHQNLDSPVKKMMTKDVKSSRFQVKDPAPEIKTLDFPRKDPIPIMMIDPTDSPVQPIKFLEPWSGVDPMEPSVQRIDITDVEPRRLQFYKPEPEYDDIDYLDKNGNKIPSPRHQKNNIDPKDRQPGESVDDWMRRRGFQVDPGMAPWP